jgi:hypothetical protein
MGYFIYCNGTSGSIIRQFLSQMNILLNMPYVVGREDFTTVLFYRRRVAKL